MSARPRRRQLERRETGRGVRDESSCNRSAALRTSACLAKQGATDGTSDNEGEEWQRASVLYGADRDFDRDRHQER